MKNETNRKIIIEKEKDDLYSIFCDYYDAAHKWLASGSGIRLDSFIKNICTLGSSKKLSDIDTLDKIVPLLPLKQQFNEIMSCTSHLLHKESTPHHIDSSRIRILQANLRETEKELERSIGKLQNIVENNVDVRNRLSMRKKIEGAVSIKKGLKGFATLLSDIEYIDWNASYSVTRIKIAPKGSLAFYPFISPLFDASIERLTNISVTMQQQKMMISVDGEFKCNFPGISRIPAMYIHYIVIDGQEGLCIEGDRAKVSVFQKDDTPALTVSVRDSS